MSILNVQFGIGQGKKPDGSPFRIDPATALKTKGPVVQVVVSVPPKIAEQLSSQGKTIPAPISGWGLVDTGAVGTCVDEEVAKKLELPVVNVTKMASASHEETLRNVYPISFEIAGLVKHINCPLTIGAPLAKQGIILLVGRDMLSNACLFYNGKLGQFTLTL